MEGNRPIAPTTHQTHDRPLPDLGRDTYTGMGIQSHNPPSERSVGEKHPRECVNAEEGLGCLIPLGVHTSGDPSVRNVKARTGLVMRVCSENRSATISTLLRYVGPHEKLRLVWFRMVVHSCKGHEHKRDFSGRNSTLEDEKRGVNTAPICRFVLADVGSRNLVTGKRFTTKTRFKEEEPLTPPRPVCFCR